MNRKNFLKISTSGAAGIMAMPLWMQACSPAGDSTSSQEANDLFFDISLAQWSLHKEFFGPSMRKSKQDFLAMRSKDPESVIQGRDPLEFASISRNEFGIDAIEFVSQFYPKIKGADDDKIKALKQRSDDEGVRNVLIMVDYEGAMGDPDERARLQAVQNHQKWVDVASYLGCHSIRTNAQSSGTKEEQKERAIDGLARLSEYAAKQDINVLVENHGGISSNGEWLASVIAGVGMDNCGTLPDFGNFRISPYESDEEILYDPYKGIEELMPYAKGVSAKSNFFDEKGNEINLDYDRILNIVNEAGYTGYIGIEYEGGDLSEADGINATLDLLKRAGKKVTETT
jgi:sugar phosphate isomerase/epimerase